MFFDPWECDDSNNKKNPPKDCAGVENGTAYLDNCGTCVGGTTGKESCTQDCTGVLGGSAYVNYCGKCIDGNQGLFDKSQLSQNDLNTFQNALAQYQSSCFGSFLLSQLNPNSGIQVSFSYSDVTANTSPCDVSIRYNPSDALNSNYWSAELFHLYQDQYYKGILSQMSEGKRQTGGSNIEAEEKLITTLSALLIGNGVIATPDWNMAYNFLSSFMQDHSIGSTVSNLTPAEEAAWFSFVQNYQTYWSQQPADLQHLNSQPVDYSLLPVAFLDLWNKLKCK